jgi:hypothetical protein
MSDDIVCWKCGAPLKEVPQPFARLAECLNCHAQLHVCKLCRFYDTSKAKHCAEPIAEEVLDKTRANFCDLFQPRAEAYQPADTDALRQAHAGLAALFGDSAEDAAKPSEADLARERLEQLFGGKSDKSD